MMTQRNTLPGLGAAMVGAALLAACSDGTGPEALDDAVLADMALVAADATLEDFNLMRIPFGFDLHAVHGMGGGHAGRPGGHLGIGGSFTGTREVTFYDAGGGEQEAYSPSTTAVIHVLHEIEGNISRDSWSATIARSRDMTISGLAGEETHRQFDGSGTEDIARSRHLEDGGERTYQMKGAFTYEGVVVPVPGSEPRWPTSGTITRHMTVAIVNGPNGDVTRTVEIVITFDGDETATAMVNGEAFEIDLSATDGRWPLRKRHGGG